MKKKNGYHFFLRTLVLLVVAGTLFYIVKELRANFGAVYSAHLRFHVGGVLCGILFIMGSYLATTYAWLLAIKTYPSENKIEFGESVAIVNSTQLSKYLPGKIWSYALQMVIMEKKGIPKSFVLYINAIIIVSSLVTNILIATPVFLFYHNPFWGIAIALIVCSGAVAYTGFLIAEKRVTKVLSWVLGRFNKTLLVHSMKRSDLIAIQVPIICSNLLFGFSGIALCHSIGFAISPGKTALVCSSMLLADLVGFVMVFSPGGLGVREGALFFLLNPFFGTGMSLIIPLVMRFFSMISDMVLGVIAFCLYRKYSAFSKKTGVRIKP